MPRDGSNIYHRPVGTDGVPNYPIESTKYNANVADVEQDLNLPRPIVAGGTGASDAHTALINLHGEESGQVVTNYDSFPFVAGSFYSAPGATAEPVASQYFSGVCYVINSNTMYLEGRVGGNTTPQPLWVRTKAGGNWGAWVKQSTNTVSGTTEGFSSTTADMFFGVTGTSPSSAFVVSNKADLSGINVLYVGRQGNVSITAPASSPVGVSMTAATGSTADISISSTRGANARWQMRFGGNPTDDFDLNRFNDSGGFVDRSLLVSRVTGNVSLGHNLTVGDLATSGTIAFGNSGTHYISYDTTNSFQTSNNLSVTGDIKASRSATEGAYFFGTSTANFIQFLASSNAYVFGGAGWIQSVGIQCRAGQTGVYGADIHNMMFTGATQLWINSTNVGNITVTSDYRTKKDVTELPGMWDTVKALRPIKYTQADFTPPAQTAVNQKQAGTRPVTPMYQADNIERWGFIAHELQATLTPTASTGVKDSPDTVQSPNPFTVVAALTKALQEAMARIEALEAR